jgi:serine/threonine protein kinase
MHSDLSPTMPLSSSALAEQPIIGVGGFSLVSSLQTPDGMVALKLARDDGEAEACLRHEYALLRSLCVEPDGTACPFVPLVYGLLTATSTQAPHLVMAMQYIEGQSLGDWLLTCVPTVQDLETLTGHLARLLRWLEQQRVLHHDLSPANIMRRPDGSLVLIDFGLAERVCAHGRGFQPLGTPGYLAPERERGKRVSFQSDLYSVGCFLTDLLCSLEETEPLVLLQCWKEVIEAMLDVTPWWRIDARCLQQAHRRLCHLREALPHHRWGRLLRWRIPWTWWRIQSILRQSKREMISHIISLFRSLKVFLQSFSSVR